MLDSARAHHAKIIQHFHSLVKQGPELIFLPLHSPKLNPIEPRWKFMHEWMTNDKLHPTLDGILKDLRAFLEGLKVPKEAVKSRCCFF
ncbi:MAG: transposase [Candidatus Sigynarchaeota archaeon]